MSLHGRHGSFQTVVIKRYFHCSEVPNRIATYRRKKLRLKDTSPFSWPLLRVTNKRTEMSWCNQSSENGKTSPFYDFLPPFIDENCADCLLSSTAVKHSLQRTLLHNRSIHFNNFRKISAINGDKASTHGIEMVQRFRRHSIGPSSSRLLLLALYRVCSLHN